MADDYNILAKHYPDPRSATYYGEAARRMRIMKDEMRHQDLQQLTKSFTLPDGTVIFCQSMFGVDKIKVMPGPMAPPPMPRPEAPEFTPPEPWTDEPPVITVPEAPGLVWVVLYEKGGVIYKRIFTDSQLAKVMSGEADAPEELLASSEPIPFTGDYYFFTHPETVTSFLISKRFLYRGKEVYYVQLPFRPNGAKVQDGFRTNTMEDNNFGSHGIIIPETGEYVVLPSSEDDSLVAVGEYIYCATYNRVTAYELSATPSGGLVLTEKVSRTIEVTSIEAITASGKVYGTRIDINPLTQAANPIYTWEIDILTGNETLLFSGINEVNALTIQYCYPTDIPDDYGVEFYTYSWSLFEAYTGDWTEGNPPTWFGESGTFHQTMTEVRTYNGVEMLNHSQIIDASMSVTPTTPGYPKVLTYIIDTVGMSGYIHDHGDWNIPNTPFHVSFAAGFVSTKQTSITTEGSGSTMNMEYGEPINPLSVHWVDDVVYSRPNGGTSSHRRIYCRKKDVFFKSITYFEGENVNQHLLLSYNNTDRGQIFLDKLGITPFDLLGVYIL